MTEKTQAEKWAVLAQAAALPKPCGCTEYERLKTRLRLCGLNSEEYGVGFRKGSDLAGLLNDFLKEQYANRNMQTLAEAYGVQKALIAQ